MSPSSNSIYLILNSVNYRIVQ